GSSSRRATPARSTSTRCSPSWSLVSSTCPTPSKFRSAAPLSSSAMSSGTSAYSPELTAWFSVVHEGILLVGRSACTSVAAVHRAHRGVRHRPLVRADRLDLSGHPVPHDQRAHSDLLDADRRALLRSRSNHLPDPS